MLAARINKLSKTMTGKYILVGGSIYLFELLVIVVSQYLGASALLAVGLSFWLGLVASFLLQKLFTFQDQRMHKKVLITQILAVSALVLFNFGFTLFVTKIFAGKLPAVITRTVALGLTTIWNFYLYRTRIFFSSLPLHVE